MVNQAGGARGGGSWRNPLGPAHPPAHGARCQSGSHSGVLPTWGAPAQRVTAPGPEQKGGRRG